jgi:hypothetical protein
LLYIVGDLRIDGLPGHLTVTTMPPRCVACGKELASRRATYCGTACKKQTYRPRLEARQDASI